MSLFPYLNLLHLPLSYQSVYYDVNTLIGTSTCIYAIEWYSFFNLTFYDVITFELNCQTVCVLPLDLEVAFLK